MVASSTSGRGQGVAVQQSPPPGKLPEIHAAGRATSRPNASPPLASDHVILPLPLDGGYDAYVVMLTPINTDAATYVAIMSNDEDGRFSRFLVVNEDEADFFYLVVSKGFRATVS